MRNLLEFCAYDIPMLSCIPSVKQVFGKRCGKCGILTATKRVNLYFLANLLSKNHINLRKTVKFSSP
ncbi:hypothetical protein [Campylobacter concisus]|uniref:hypothetical protein n=1 Tax=Campylobacter concisus TaxID=199 RepID=UPI00122C79DD|nr:hypothetical protein [Campylobacter concisus]